MRFPKRLITPVLAAVMLVGGAAYAQEVVDGVIEGDVLEVGPITWSYDTTSKTFIWGECDVASSTEVTDDLLSEVVEADSCHEVGFGDPDDPSEYTAVVEIPGDDAEGNHGGFVSGFGEKLREIPKDELDGNRGSFMRVIAQLNPFKDDEGDGDSATTIEEADDSGKPDKAAKEANPNKANGRQDK